ncbi:MAG: sterol desaturase family protein, partial [Bdellovibrionales bacterium]|nr:sterol desaturase family protein [Bdellovibrionales bacterium]
MSHAERLLKIAKEVFVETSLLSTLHIAYFFVFFAVGCLVFRFAYKTHWSNLAGKVLPAGIYRNPQLLLDVKMVLLNRFISSFIVIYLGFSLFEFFQPIRSQSVGFFESIFSRPAALTSENIMINLLWSFSSAFARDFNRAYVHYLFHNIPFFWQFHKVHHSAQTLTPFSNFRQHPVDWYLTNVSQAVLHSVLFAAFYFFFGEHFNFYLFAGVSALGVFIKVLWPFKHSHIWISYGPLSYIFSSPAMHQIHHSLDPTHKNKNFANTFSVIDWMFGTLYVPSQEEHFP